MDDDWTKDEEAEEEEEVEELGEDEEWEYVWSEEEVEAILGEPSTRQDKDSISSRSWQKDGCTISIVFWPVCDYWGKRGWSAGYGMLHTSDGIEQHFYGRSGTIIDDLLRYFR